MHPNLLLLGAFLKIEFKKIYFPTDRPKYSEIPLEGNTSFFSFFGLKTCTAEGNYLQTSIYSLILHLADAKDPTLPPSP